MTLLSYSSLVSLFGGNTNIRPQSEYDAHNRYSPNCDYFVSKTKELEQSNMKNGQFLNYAKCTMNCKCYISKLLHATYTTEGNKCRDVYVNFCSQLSPITIKTNKTQCSWIWLSQVAKHGVW